MLPHIMHASMLHVNAHHNFDGDSFSPLRLPLSEPHLGGNNVCVCVCECVSVCVCV